ncbi:MAG: polysaccharide biosynthesis protein [Clostridia bacterium]|nr:polysaccharide biosynthesis protein [Clostridia bacterium]
MKRAKRLIRVETKGQGFLKGAATIAVGGFLAKLIGALYRIPLTNLIGGYGMGLYQMVYPFYCLLLTVSATGIPSSIAKLTAEKRALGESDEPIFKSALKLFLLIGGAGTFLMLLLAPVLSAMQGSLEVRNGYFALAPSVFLVSAISVLRGWFQGRKDMRPTALSEVFEQLVKVGFGLMFAYLYRGYPVKAVSFLLLSVTFSELAALLLLFFLYKRTPQPYAGLKNAGAFPAKKVLALSIPVTLSSAILPLSGLIESVLIVRLLKGYSENAVALYGLFSGGAVTIINLPVSIAYGIAAASVPAVSAAFAKEREGQQTGARRRVLLSLGLTAALGAVSALGLFLFAAPAVKMIFRSLSAGETDTLVRLVKLLSVSALLLSCTQTLSACLTGLGKPKFAAISMSVAVAFRLALDFLLVSRPKISVYGAAIAADVCYLVAFALDLVYNLIITKRSERADDNGSGLGHAGRRIDGAGQGGDIERGQSDCEDGEHPLV